MTRSALLLLKLLVAVALFCADCFMYRQAVNAVVRTGNTRYLSVYWASLAVTVCTMVWVVAS